MEDSKPLDKFVQSPEGKGDQTIKLFVASLVLLFIAGLTVLLSYTIGLPHESLLLLIPACGITSFAISIGGINVGASEIKHANKFARTGLIGNIILTALPVLYFLYNAALFIISLI